MHRSSKPESFRHDGFESHTSYIFIDVGSIPTGSTILGSDLTFINKFVDLHQFKFF